MSYRRAANLTGGRELNKNHLVFEAVGTLDELVGVLILANLPQLNSVFTHLALIRAEIASSDRYALAEQNVRITRESIESLETLIKKSPLEKIKVNGYTILAAALTHKLERRLLDLRDFEEKNKSKASPIIPEGFHPEADYLRGNLKIRDELLEYIDLLARYLYRCV